VASKQKKSFSDKKPKNFIGSMLISLRVVSTSLGDASYLTYQTPLI
jgi:hypothetical protein